MNNRYNILLLIAFSVITLILTSCGTARQAERLAAHQSMLTALAASDKDPEEKLDIMMSNFTEMMHQTLDILNPKRGVEYVKAYTSQNGDAINSIMSEVGTIPEGKSTLQMIELAFSMTNKPYMEDFIRLLPRFQRKYNQISFVLGLTGKIKNGLLNLGLKSLGL